jgi:hypothetical protein
MYSGHGDLKEAGFPHSEICGSAPICRLPAAYRRLSRPSSPIIAKASTTCTYSLDSITLLPAAFRAESAPGQSPPEHHNVTDITLLRLSLCIRARIASNAEHDAIHNPVSPRRLATHATLRAHPRPRGQLYLLSQIVKEQPIAVSRRNTNQHRASATLIAGSSCAQAPVPGPAGGANRDRTDDLLLAKQALSQLSYGPVEGVGWWVWMDSNHRPPPYQDGALTN